MKLHNYLSKIEQEFTSLTDDFLDSVAETGQKHAQNTSSFKYHTNTGLKGNINIIKNGHFARTVLANKDYAYYLEYGNNQKGPYIYPVRAKALHFWINGKEIFAKRVRSHAGYYFMRHAKDFAISQADKLLKSAFKKLI